MRTLVITLLVVAAGGVHATQRDLSFAGPPPPPKEYPQIGPRTPGTLTDADVAAAIRAGEANKFDNIAVGCIARAGFGEGLGAAIAGGVQRDGAFTVAISGPAGLIAALAMNQKRLYQPLTVSAVPPEMRTPKLVAVVAPENPSLSATGHTMSVAAEIQHVVLASKNRSVIMQPVSVQTQPVGWSNLLGGSVQANQVTATFDNFAMAELPSGDVDAIVVTSAGERRCTIKQKDRQRVFGR